MNNYADNKTLKEAYGRTTIDRNILSIEERTSRSSVLHTSTKLTQTKLKQSQQPGAPILFGAARRRQPSKLPFA